MANNAIGILFEVKGGGDINGETGKRINGQLRNLVGQINKTDTLRLKFQIDSNHINKQIKQLQQQLQELSSGGTSSSGRKGSSNTSNASQQTKAYRAATAAMREYYDAQLKYARRSSRTSNPSVEYKELYTSVEMAKQKMSEYFDVASDGSLRVKNSIAGITSEQREMLEELARAKAMKYDADIVDIDNNAEQKWSNLTAKVHDYINRVEESASRNHQAAASLKELREMANSTDYHGYDELKKKLAEVQQYINENALATETWGQKMIKTFGSRVRSALAGIITAKIGQFIKEVYDNVVELDAALTNLQIATGKTREETQKLIVSYAALAKQLGATTLEVAEAADTWLRQGYAAQEANTLITNSTMLAKLGQMESAEASKALTSAMKGYGVEVNRSIGIVDKFTAVDMEAAASAGDIATAMAETATSAKIAGVSMDTLIGYIATVKEVTQDGAESVGTFYKTLFARMNNVAAGNFIDEETGEALNDVETVLNGLGIALRDVNGEFRNSADVLSEVGNRWQEFDTVEKHAIATAMAGTRQQEKFIVLMENYETAMRYATTATESAGTALEKYSAYTESIDGKMNSLKATFEEFSMTILNSELVTFVVEFLQTVLEVMSFADGLIAKLAILTASIAVLTYATHALSAALAKQKIIIAGGFKNFLLYIQYVKAMATSNGVATAMIDAQTAAIIRQYTTGLTGLLTFIPRLIAALWTWIATNIKAKLANDATTASAIKLNAAMQAFNISPIMLAITAVVAACATLITIIDAVGTAWEDAYERAKENAAKQKELIAEYDSEIESLESLQQKLEDAHGSRQKLSNIYSELNSKVAVSAGLLAGEEDAYKAVNAQIEDQIKAMRALRQEAAANKIAEERSAFDNNRASRYGDILHNWLGLTSGSLFMWDFAASDATGEQMRDAMRGRNDALPNFSYDTFYNEWDTDKQDIWLRQQGFTRESWDKYWQGQVDVATEIFADTVKNADGIFGDTFMASAMERLIRSGYNLDETSAVLDELISDSDGLNQKVGEYYEALMSGSEDAPAIYDEIMAVFDGYIEKYPDLTDIFATLISSIRTADSEQTAFTVTLQTLSEMLEKTGGAYDALTRAMQEMQTTGALTSSTIQTIINDFPELLDYLEETADGFIVADNAMSNFLADMRATYLVNVTKAQEAYKIAYEKYESSDKKTEEDRKAVEAAQESLQNAIDNANNWLRTEAVLTRSTIFEEYTNLLKEQQNAIEDEYDAYKELCELRKDLLQTYQDELDYKKKLKAAQDSVTRLSTQLAVSRLDTSAAGQARTRELQASLQDAEDELDDITLEHAIEILENQLESQMVQYENFIQNQIRQIEQTIKDAVKLSTDELAAALEKAGGSSASSNSASDRGTANDGSSVSTDNSSYNSTVNNAQSYLDTNNKISNSNYREPTEEEKIAAEIVQFGDASGSGMNSGKSGDNGIIKWGGNEYKVQNSGTVYDSSTPLYKAAINIKQFKDRQIFGYGGKVYGYLDSHIQEIEGRAMSKKGYNNFVSAMKANYGSYHTGGLVGDIATLSTSEEFAKLLKGEFVSTPMQMKRFMEETLPKIANYTSSGGTNEFNAPLIEIKCENVTSEALPELERVIDEAVKEVKRQLDSGMSRTGFKRPTTKRLT